MPASDDSECGCAKCCLPTIVQERDAAEAYGDQQRNRAKTAELQVEAIANEAARLREENARLENLASALNALAMVLSPPAGGTALRNPWQDRSAAVAEAKRFLKDGTSVIGIIEAERDQARADLAAAKATIATLTTEEQKWRDSFFTAIAKRDTMRLALSSIENDICDEPFQGLEAPCGCCRSHIKTARRALDE